MEGALGFAFRPMRSALLLTAIAVLSLAPSRSDACGAPPCTDEHRFSPGPGESVPETVEALVLSVTGPLGDAGVTLRRADGGSIPVALSQTPETVLIRAPDLRLGEWMVEFPSQCGTHTVTNVFSVGPSEPLPVDAGLLGLIGEGLGSVVTENDGTCTETINAAWAVLGFHPSAELTPHLPVTRAMLVVDGAPWAVSDWGDIGPDGRLARAGTRNVFLTYSACGQVSRGSDPGLDQGSHSAVLQLFVAGRQGALSVGPVHFTLSCEREPKQPPPVVGTPDDPPVDMADGGASDINDRSGCGGCGGASASIPLSALGLLAFAVRRARC